MKYFITIFVTAVLVFLGATIYFKGIPSFPGYSKTAVSTQSGAPAVTNETFSSPQAGASGTPVDETPDIIAAVKNALVVEHGPDATSLDVAVSKIEGSFAQGTASEQGGGGIWYAAKVQGQWKLVWDGNGEINCVVIGSYPTFPKDMIPECWDTTTNKAVTR